MGCACYTGTLPIPEVYPIPEAAMSDPTPDPDASTRTPGPRVVAALGILAAVVLVAMAFQVTVGGVGRVSVPSVTPPDAILTIVELERERTGPGDLDDVRAGIYTLRIEAPGYRTETRQLRVGGRGATEVAPIELTPVGE